MTNEELKLISASNIINLRKKAGITQAELGNVLSYSDKTISKWERAETIPDAYVLTQIASYFGVDVDYLLTAHDEWELPVLPEESHERLYDSNAIMAVTLLGVFTAFLATFVILWICGYGDWRILLVGVTCAAIVYLILDCIFKNHRHIKLALVILICTVFVLIYFAFDDHRPWQIFLLSAPALAIALIATTIKKEGSPIRRDKENQ